METIIAATASYIGGVISGYVFACLWKPSNDKKQGDIVLVVVTLIWALSMIIDIVSTTYETSPLVHGLMGAIVGFFYKPIFKIGEPEQKK
jgi:hypothetical protein